MRVRVAASAAVAALVVVAVTGCGLITPQATTKRYDPSDGVSADIGDVAVRNVIAIAGDTKRTAGDANLVMTAVNGTEDAVTLRVQYRSGSGEKDLSIRLDPGLNKVGYGTDGLRILTGFHPKPGALARIYLQYGTAQGAQLRVPVLNNSWSSYSNLGPTPTPTATPRSTNPPVTPPPVPAPSATTRP